MEAIGNLTGGMAHDFNNLLGIIIGNLDLVRGLTTCNGEIDEAAGEALDAAFRGAELTRRLLAFARRQPLQPACVDVNELVGETEKLLVRTLGADVQIAVELAPGLWPVKVDPTQLEAALINLANNARDAMPKGGQLTITTDNRQLDEDFATLHGEVAPGDYAMIEVSDTGCGMSPEITAKIFEPFFTTKEQGKGTGLGLSMLFGFVKQSAGHLNVYSEPGIGTTFRLYLPRTKSAVVAEPVAIGKSPLGQGQTILVVEDQENLRRLVLRQVRDLGYRAVEAENAAAALVILERQYVDLLLTDIVMPGSVNGLDLARTTLDRWPQMRVVLTSGFPGRTGGSFDGATRLLVKPYRKADLARTLYDALNN
jgi:CheY-like chemotaxis protein